MLNTILFDLDGTLLPMDQKEFVSAYFKELLGRMSKMGCEEEMLSKTIWAGTKAMMENDGSALNKEVFFKVFEEMSGLEASVYEPIFDRFYVEEFDRVKRILGDSFGQKELLLKLREKNYRIVLATAPLFPRVAVNTRLSWIGLSTEDFDYVTSYENSRHSKPNPDYYREIFKELQCKPEECLMIGNNAVEDMCVGELGAETFLLLDYLEAPADMDISSFKRGSVGELKELIEGLKMNN